MEAVVAGVGIAICGIVALAVYGSISDLNSPISRISKNFTLLFLACLAMYFLIRFVHWAWDTPLPFVGTN